LIRSLLASLAAVSVFSLSIHMRPDLAAQGAAAAAMLGKMLAVYGVKASGSAASQAQATN
jgi:hypothetical protein